MTPFEQYSSLISRRHFFGQSAIGLGTAALTTLLPQSTPAAEAQAAVGGLPGAVTSVAPSRRGWWPILAATSSEYGLDVRNAATREVGGKRIRRLHRGVIDEGRRHTRLRLDCFTSVERDLDRR